MLVVDRLLMVRLTYIHAYLLLCALRLCSIGSRGFPVDEDISGRVWILHNLTRSRSSEAFTIYEL